MSGLATTHYLSKQGVDVRTFEADSEPGGVVDSRTIDGHVLERGPQRLRRSAPVDELIEEFDLEDEVRVGHDDQPLYGYYDGALRPMPLSVRDAITTDLLSWRGKARILFEPLTGPVRDGETVAEFLTRKFGPEASRRFMGPLYSGLYGTEADDMYVKYSLGKALAHVGIDDQSILRYVLRRLIEGIDTPPIITFEDGLQTVANAIYDAHHDSIDLSTPVTGVESVGDRYRIETENDEVTVDSIVLTTPAPTTASLLAAIDERSAEAVGEFNYNPIGVVHLESAYDRDGHGFHVIDEGFETNGSTWNHSMLDREGIYTSYIGSGNPQFLDADPAVVGQRAADEFERITGAEADVLDVTVVRPGMPAYDRSWTALDDVSLPDDVAICSAFTARAGVVGRIRDGKRIAAEMAGH